MGSWNSKLGIWEPALERAVNPDAPEGQEVYEGPDRDATAYLKEQGVDHIGTHFSMDADLIMRARQMNFKNPEEYLKAFGFDKVKAEEAYQKKATEVVTHKPVPVKAPINPVSGGQDTTGSGKSLKGGMGDFKQELAKVS